MTSDPSQILRVTRRFEAEPERVFPAWIDPATTGRWLFMCPETDVNDRLVAIEARVGGTYRITSTIRGHELEAVGEYVEIDPPRRLVFTFAIPQFGPHVDRIVVEIELDGTGSLLTLTHERLPPELHGPATSGWDKMFDRLATALGAQSEMPDQRP